MGFVKSYEEIVGNATESADFYDGEMLMAVWETRPEAVDKLLPPPLKPAESPLVLAFVANYPSTNFSVPYSESALFLRASFEEQEGLSIRIEDRSDYEYSDKYCEGSGCCD